MEPKNENSVGPLIGTIIIFLVLVAGGVYLLQNKTRPAETTPPATEEVQVNQEAVQPETSVVPTEDISTIEADFSSINTTELDADVADIGKELQ